MPFAAGVAYAAAMDIGETFTTPSVKEGRSSAGGWSGPSAWSSDLPSTRVMPRFTAVFTVLHRPTFCSRLAKKTLIDPVVPV